MAVRRCTISFDASVLTEAERLAEERGETLSVFVNAAVMHALKVEAGRNLIAEDIERFGPMSESVTADVNAR